LQTRRRPERSSLPQKEESCGLQPVRTGPTEAVADIQIYLKALNRAALSLKVCCEPQSREAMRSEM